VGISEETGASYVASWTDGSSELRQGLTEANQLTAVTSNVAHKIHPRVVVPTPTYFSPEAKITKVIEGLM